MQTLIRAATAAVVAVGLTLATAVPVSATTDDEPTLRELAEQANILIGSGAVKASDWTNDGREPNYLADPNFAEVLAEQFNSASPENDLKWVFVQPEEGVFDWEGLDRLVAFAE